MALLIDENCCDLLFDLAATKVNSNDLIDIRYITYLCNNKKFNYN